MELQRLAADGKRNDAAWRPWPVFGFPSIAEASGRTIQLDSQSSPSPLLFHQPEQLSQMIPLATAIRMATNAPGCRPAPSGFTPVDRRFVSYSKTIVCRSAPSGFMPVDRRFGNFIG